MLVTTDLPSWDLQLRSDPPSYALGATTNYHYLLLLTRTVLQPLSLYSVSCIPAATKAAPLFKPSLGHGLGTGGWESVLRLYSDWTTPSFLHDLANRATGPFSASNTLCAARTLGEPRCPILSMQCVPAASRACTRHAATQQRRRPRRSPDGSPRPARLARALLPAEAGRLDELLMRTLTILESESARRAQLAALPMAATLVERSGSRAVGERRFGLAVGFDDATSVAAFGTVLLRLANEMEGALLVAYLEP